MYNVDGFRFDLAELLGIEFLKKAESRLKKIKKSVILIAEPWSFRGNIGHEIRSTGFSAWNDEYRNFAADYILGNGNRDGLEYFISGSLGYRSSFPAQTVNYVSSHDDRCWMDKVTENPNNDGKTPTVIDRRRTNLSIALLLSSIGIPMFSAGHDILHSKSGVQNTYQRGDLNALNYERGAEYSATHKYMCDYIKLRKSHIGRLLHPEKRPSKNYLKAFAPIENSSAIAVLFNASHELGKELLLFTINPHFSSATFNLSEINFKKFVQLADTECVNTNVFKDAFHLPYNDLLTLPKVSCGLWTRNNIN
jgi:pullulanase/glycogen debranching enzyme